MSVHPAPDPAGEATPSGALELVILPRSADLGDGFTVRRVLPFARRRMVGPFAKADWRAGRFQMVPGDAEFIPLPG